MSQSASTQPVVVDDDIHSQRASQSNRLPRLRRCRCCNKGRKPAGAFVRYRGVKGCQVTTFENFDYQPRFDYHGGFEIERVTIHPTGGQSYELIRGGRWVNDWEATYGKHKDEGNKWVRKSLSSLQEEKAS